MPTPHPAFIHLLSHSFLRSFALNFHHDSGCCGESCEQEAKHPAPSSSGSDGKSTGKHAEQGQRRDPSSTMYVSHLASTACLACTWDSSEPSPIPSQSPLSLLLPQTTKVHKTKPMSFTTEPGFSFWDAGERMHLMGTCCSR